MGSNYGFTSVNHQVNGNKTPPNDIFNAIERVNQKMIYARVTDIILNDQHPQFTTLGGWSSIGTIFFQEVESSNTSTRTSTTALPLVPYLKSYPLVNEFVLLFLLPNKGVATQINSTSYFYLNPISIWNNQHLNAYPNIDTPTTQKSEQKNYQAIEDGQTRKSSSKEVNYSYNSPLIGGTFEERSNIHPLLSFAGDIITEGRWGNSIRLGSTALTTKGIYNNNWSSKGENGNPITIIRNGQPLDAGGVGFKPIIEDINKDLSSLYLTSNQSIPLNLSVNSNPSISKTPPASAGTYTGSQVILNSNRLVFNTTADSILLSSKKSISLASIGTIGLFSQQGDIVLQTSKNLIRLGDSGANQSVILGDNFLSDLTTLLKKFQLLTSALSVDPSIPSSNFPASSVNDQLAVFIENIPSYASKTVKTI